MPITVNGETATLPDPPTLEALVCALAPRRPFAVAINEDFVTRASFLTRDLKDGDRVEIVHPSAGG